MSNKYKVKGPGRADMCQYKEICIRCGKQRWVEWLKSLPIPNMGEYLSKPSWFQCLIGFHHWYQEDQVEPAA